MRIKKLLACVTLLGLCLVGLSANAWAEVKDDGSKRCLKCHDEEAGWMAKTPHANTDDARVPTCIACHGESAGHLKASSKVSPDRRFKGAKGLPSAEASAVCLSCHDKDARRTLWAGSTHPNADVACSNCHVVHNKGQDRVLGKRTQADVCFTCHKEQRTKANLPSHHPVPEGKMTCADCHNVHGSAGAKLVKRDNNNDTCYTCHAEKRGPFVHNHAPVQDDCVNCHNPHGATTPAMLKARPPMLCQQCHTPHVGAGVGALGGQAGVFPPAVGGQSSSAVTAASSAKNVVNFWQGRSCLNCHTQIHGSNNPATTNPTPQLFVR